MHVGFRISLDAPISAIISHAECANRQTLLRNPSGGAASPWVGGFGGLSALAESGMTMDCCVPFGLCVCMCVCLLAAAHSLGRCRRMREYRRPLIADRRGAALRKAPGTIVVCIAARLADRGAVA